MNRKLFNGLLLLTVATGGVGTFTSCKDTEQEFRNEVLVGQEDILGQIARIRNLTDDVFKNNLDREIQALIDAGNFATVADLLVLQGRVEAAERQLALLEQAYKDADAQLRSELETKISTVYNELKSAIDAHESRLNEIDSNITEINTRLDALSDALDEVRSTANEALTIARLNADAITTINSRLQALEDQGRVFEGKLAELADRMDALEVKYSELMQEILNLKDFQESTEFALDQLREDLDNFIAEVNDMYNRFVERFARLVTGLIVEKTYNPVFGTLNLPIGVQSNMLINYYAKAVQQVREFPSGIGANEGVDHSEVFGTQGFTLPSGHPTFSMNTGEIQLETLGNLYMTVNPITRNFDGLEFQLVTSKGAALPSTFLTEACDEELTFGYSRATSENGFYRSQIVPANEGAAALVGATEFKFNKDALIGSFKNALKNHQAGDFVQLAKVLYDQFNGVLPAYAAKVTWTEEDADAEHGSEAVVKSVISGYDLAVASFYPLSYSVNIDGTNRQLPTFGSLKSAVQRAFDSIKSRLNLGLEHVTLDEISIDLNLDIKVNATSIEIDLSGSPVFDEEGWSYVDGKFYYNGELKSDAEGRSHYVGVLAEGTKIVLGYDPNKNTVHVDPNETALNEFVDSIIDSIKESINGTDNKEGIADQINSQINDQLESIVGNINGQLDKIQAKVNNTVSDIEDRIMAQLNGRLGNAAQSLIDLYNRFATEINNILKNPNDYLQVVMAYGGKSGIHHLSTEKNDPTVIDKGVVELYLTSYNAELIVPSYKKYVAITAVDNAAADAAVNQQAGKDFNKILNGRQQSVAFNTSGLQSGKTYEIFYQSLDFRGHTSTRTYYVRVK